MLELILKDFAIQKKSLKKILFIVLFFTVYFSLLGQQIMVSTMLTFFIIYGFFNTAFYEDEKNNTLRLIASLPVRREQVVYSRYISLAIVMLVTTLVIRSLAMLLVINGIWEKQPDMDIDTVSLVVTAAFIVLLSVVMPISFRMSYIKAANINRAILFVIFGFFTVATLTLKDIIGDKPPELLTKVVEFFEEADKNLLLAAATVIVILIYLASMRVSVIMFRKRNLFQ